MISEEDLLLTFFSELEKSITKEASAQKQTIANQNTKQCRKKLKKRKFKVLFARKNEDINIPFEKKALSSAELANTTEQRDTTLGKAVGMSADIIIPITTLNRPSSIPEYRYNDFERSGRLSRNRVRDTQGTLTTFYSNFSCQLMIPTPNNL